MPGAFTAGVKPGGLNDDTQIRILLCYLVKNAAPLTRETLEGALLQEELVNYFELGSALASLEKNELIAPGEAGYTVTEKGAVVAEELGSDLPRSVRETAIRAVVRIQTWRHKQAANLARVEPNDNGFDVVCSIRDPGGDLMVLRLAMPDTETAQAVKNRFIARGSELYALLMDTLTAPGTEDDIPPEGAL